MTTTTPAQTPRVIRPPPPQWQIEWELCEIAAESSGVKREWITPASRMIQDLSLDSVALMDFIFRIEKRFGVKIPHDDEVGLGVKQVFARDLVLVRDFADVILAQWGTGTPRRLFERGAVSTTTTLPEALPFLQLDGVMRERDWREGPLYEPLPELRPGVRQYRRRTDGMRCVLIPAAEVLLGSDGADAPPDERPARRVSISAFVVDAEPISATAYARFLNSVGPVPDAVARAWFLPASDDARSANLPLVCRFGKWRPTKRTARRPMMMVSWFGANAYSLWANRLDWREYRGGGACMLPSEAQWEFAARGAEPQRFPWGNETPVPGMANLARHHAAARYEADDVPAADVNMPLGLSPFGLHHMAGNVWQWCRDWYAPGFHSSDAARQADPENQTPTGVRSERGGSWVGPAELSRSSYRRGRGPTPEAAA